MLRLGECDVALAGGVSESIHTFGIFASFKSQGALADMPTRLGHRVRSTATARASSWPKGGCMYVLERLDDARRRGAPISRRTGRATP